jgi:hypothetical protein
MRLSPDSRGRRYGLTGRQAFAQTYMPLFPPVLLLLVVRFVARGWPPYLAPIAACVPLALPQPAPYAVPVLAGFGSLLASMAGAYVLIPSAVRSPFATAAHFLGLVCGRQSLKSPRLQSCRLAVRSEQVVNWLHCPIPRGKLPSLSS